MDPSDLLRHQIINNLMAQHTENVADAGITMWEQVATQIISIVGEDGFNSLYVRSVFLTRSTFPWLAADSVLPQTDHRFAELKKSFEGQAQANEANILLLITFTDILASLIGEELTSSILRSAWGNDASDRAGKEFKNE